MIFNNITAIVLAGGKSLRMGSDKSRLPVGEKSLIEYVLKQLEPCFGEILISTNDRGRPTIEGFKSIPDREPGKGPLMGIVSAMAESKNELNFVQACDIPETNYEVVAKMLSTAGGFDAVVPQTREGHLEPLFAVYGKSALKAMEHVIEHERGKAHLVHKHCNAKLMRLEQSEELFNLNTPEDYETFLRRHPSLF